MSHVGGHFLYGVFFTEGKRGFITQTSWKSGPDGLTHLTFGSYVKAPPWPFKPIYFNKIHPQWTDCYQRAIDAM